MLEGWVEEAKSEPTPPHSVHTGRTGSVQKPPEDLTLEIVEDPKKLKIFKVREVQTIDEGYLEEE